MNQNNISLEKVIKGLSRHGNNNCEYNKETMCPYWGDSHCSSHLCLDAIALLKAQEPAKPEMIMYTGAGIGISNCPQCGCKIDEYHNDKFCGSCGRAVKWE